MNQRLKAALIVLAVLIPVGVWGWLTGEFADFFDDVANIWNYFF